MSDTESFESVYERLYPQLHNPCGLWKAATIAEWLDDLERAHDREIRDTAQQEYHRGFNAGRHSMDAEHRAVAMRLRQLPLDGGSVENVFNIARAVYHNDFGWAANDCAALRDELVRLMGGVSEPSVADVAKELMDTIIKESNERLQNDGKAEIPSITEADDDTCGAGCGCAAADSDGDCGLQRAEVTDERLADDCGADSRGGDGGGGVHMAGVSIITDELREWMSTVLTSDDYAWAIADRIDEQFGRCCELWERVAQDAIHAQLKAEEERDELRRKMDELEKFDADTSLAAFGDDNDKLRRLLSRAAKLLEIAEHDRDTNYAYWMDCKDKVVHANITIDELQAKLDEYGRTHTELPMDKSGEVFHIGCTVRMVGRDPEVLLTVHSMTMCNDGEWRLYAVSDKDEYTCNLDTSKFEVCEKQQDTLGAIVHDLIMNNITESQAVERIEALNG